MKILDLSTWNRKEHYQFFSSLDQPFFGITTEVDCTTAFDYAKSGEISFFAYYMFQSIRAANAVENFRMRVVDGQVVIYDQVHAGSTIGRKDGTFGFSFIPYNGNFGDFKKVLDNEIQAVENTIGIRTNEAAFRKDVIHYTTLPWNTFSGFSHARSFNTGDTVPKIAFGRAHLRGNRRYLPLAVDVHHGLMDGIHVAAYLEKFQENLKDKPME